MKTTNLLKEATIHMGFELVSMLGRLVTPRLEIDPTLKNYINLGSGRTYKERILDINYVNIDFFLTRSKKDYKADLRFPLKINDNSIDGIVCEHTLEHLTYEDGINLLKECHRVLKPGGIIRIIVPNMLFIYNCYINPKWFNTFKQVTFTDSPWSFRRNRKMDFPAEMLSFMTQECGHKSCWDSEILEDRLRKAGFAYLQEESNRQGSCQALLIDSKDRSRVFVSLYMEGKKA